MPRKPKSAPDSTLDIQKLHDQVGKEASILSKEVAGLTTKIDKLQADLNRLTAERAEKQARLDKATRIHAALSSGLEPEKAPEKAAAAPAEKAPKKAAKAKPGPKPKTEKALAATPAPKAEKPAAASPKAGRISSKYLVAFALGDGTLTAAEIVPLMKAQGWSLGGDEETKVNGLLARSTDLFERASRGKYKCKPGALAQAQAAVTPGATPKAAPAAPKAAKVKAAPATPKAKAAKAKAPAAPKAAKAARAKVVKAAKAPKDTVVTVSLPEMVAATPTSATLDEARALLAG